MGLDMYLEARKYVSQVDWDSVERGKQYDKYPQTEEYKRLALEFPEGADKYASVSGGEVKISIGYWRKVNAVHQWFVNTLADGVDDCKPIYVPREKFGELRDICILILSNKDDLDEAAKLLPTTSGFFFGETEYDEWYFSGIELTKDIMEHCLETFPLNDKGYCDYDFYYQASW